jgi:predicted nucleotidyltransferase
VSLCRELNEHGARYIVVGGMAVIQWGFTRATEDVDLLVEISQENQKKVIEALRSLPDKAVNDIRPTDLEEYQVIRIADEYIVDLMSAACGISYDQAIDSVIVVMIDGVKIPFASPELLWRMKQTMQEKDNLDLTFLRELLKKK